MEHVHLNSGAACSGHRYTQAASVGAPAIRGRLLSAIEALRMLKALPCSRSGIYEQVATSHRPDDLIWSRRGPAQQGAFLQSIKAFEAQWLSARAPETCESGS